MTTAPVTAPSQRPLIFYFNFALGNTEKTYGFAVNPVSVLQFPEAMYVADYTTQPPSYTGPDFYDIYTSPIESEFGVHDWGSRPNDAVLGIGYGTYEVPAAKVFLLMQRWRDLFIEKCGVHSVTPFVQIPNKVVNNGDDLSIYRNIRQQTNPSAMPAL